MSTANNTITVSIDAIHDLAQEMEEKVIPAQKTEVDQMVKNAESYITKIKNGLLLDNAIIADGPATGEYPEENDIYRLHIKRAKIQLKGVKDKSELETLLEKLKKQKNNYNELIEQYKKYCNKMHGSADEIEKEIADLMEEIEIILSDQGTSDDELEDPDKPKQTTTGSGSDEEIEEPNVTEKPLPTDVELIIAEIAKEVAAAKKQPTTEIPTVTTPSATPTEPTPTETPTPVVTEEPPVENYTGGYSGYVQPPAPEPAPVEAPPTIDTIVQGREVARIPTSSAPIARATTATKSSGSASFATTATAGAASAAIIGLGAKAYLDKKKQEEEENQAFYIDEKQENS